jgi:hypothetical protein
VQSQLDSSFAEHSPHVPVAASSERADIGGRMHRARTDLARKGQELLCRQADPYAQPAPAVAQRGVEIVQTFEQELRARARSMPTAQQPLIETEDRHKVLVGPERRAQRWVIVQPKIAA